MTTKTNQFLIHQALAPDIRDAATRLGDFQEIHRAFAPVSARDQASRCAQCGVPFCQNACPLHNSIPDWLRLTAEGRLEEAYHLAASTNPMPEICGRICPQDRLCEGDCVIEQSGHGGVTIGAIEKHISELAWDKGWVAPLAVSAERGQSVGVIGAGPAGLAAAESLRGHGYGVTVYDRQDRAGGLLVYGIPNFKLEKDVVARRVRRLEDSGIAFILKCDIGKDLSFDDIRARHDAVLIATGVTKARALHSAPGPGKLALPAMEYLTASCRVGLGDVVPAFDTGVLNAKGKRVVVIGGGDTAMDCVRTAVRQDAKSVTCVYRRDRANMPGSLREVANAEEEGVHFQWLAAPKEFLGTARKLSGVRVVRMRLGASDASARQTPEETPGSAFDLGADMVILALGFVPEDIAERFALRDLKTTRWGTLCVDSKTMRTSLPGIYAAGDIVRGASLVVWAIREGREAAEAIHASLTARAAAAAKIAAQ